MRGLSLFSLGAIAGALALFLLSEQRCSGPSPRRADTTVEVKEQKLKLELSYQADTPKPERVVEQKLDTVYVDTGQVIKDYYRTRYYSRSFADSPVQGQLQAKVKQNKLQEFSIKAAGSSTKEIREKTITKPPKYLLTLSLGYQTLEPGLLRRQGPLYLGAGYDIARGGLEGLQLQAAYSF
jgi:hypothetical protein